MSEAISGGSFSTHSAYRSQANSFMNQPVKEIQRLGTGFAGSGKGKGVFQGGSLNDRQNPGADVDLVRAILDHLASHPHAADSAEGVAHWWLGPRGAVLALPNVEMALRQLVARQELRQESLADGTTLYSKNGKHKPNQ